MKRGNPRGIVAARAILVRKPHRQNATSARPARAYTDMGPKRDAAPEVPDDDPPVAAALDELPEVDVPVVVVVFVVVSRYMLPAGRFKHWPMDSSYRS